MANRIAIVKELPPDMIVSGQALMKGSSKKKETQTIFDFACASS
jgi:hypothetical protein